MAKRKIEINIPEQGVFALLTPEEAEEFFDRETAFYRELQPMLDRQLQFGDRGIAAHAGVIRTAIEKIEAAKKDAKAGEGQGLSEFIHSAQTYSLVIGQGRIGQHIRMLISENQQGQAHWLLVLFSYRGHNNNWIDPFRAIAVGSPSMLSFSDLSSASQALKTSDDALDEITKAKKILDQYIASKSKLFDDLEELYREKLEQIPFTLYRLDNRMR